MSQYCPSKTGTVLAGNNKEKRHYQLDFCSVIRIYNLGFSFDPDLLVDSGQKYIALVWDCKAAVPSLCDGITPR